MSNSPPSFVMLEGMPLCRTADAAAITPMEIYSSNTFLAQQKKTFLFEIHFFVHCLTSCEAMLDFVRTGQGFFEWRSQSMPDFGLASKLYLSFRQEDMVIDRLYWYFDSSRKNQRIVVWLFGTVGLSISGQRIITNKIAYFKLFHQSLPYSSPKLLEIAVAILYTIMNVVLKSCFY